MAYTMEDFRRNYVKKHFAHLTPEEQREALERLPPEQRRQVVQSVPPEERLAGLPPEERLAGLPPEERLAGLSAEQIRQSWTGSPAAGRRRHASRGGRESSRQRVEGDGVPI